MSDALSNWTAGLLEASEAGEEMNWKKSCLVKKDDEDDEEDMEDKNSSEEEEEEEDEI